MLTTPLKRTGNALRLSDVQLRLIVDHVPALIAYFDADWRCTFCNKPYADWFGLSVASIKGRPMRDITGEIRLSKEWPAMLGAPAEETVCTLESLTAINNPRAFTAGISTA